MFRSLVIAALPFCLALAACTPQDPKEGEDKARPAVMVQPQTAGAQRDIYPGEIHARYEPALSFRIGGKISRRLVDVGDRVKKGQPLAELDAKDLHLQLDSARAQLSSAEADHRLAKNELTRYQKLLSKQLISRSQFDTVESRFEASAARLEQAQAQLDVARNQAKYAILKAPQDGVIARRLAESGQVVAAGQTVFTLAADGDREVRIDLPEQDIGHFEVGQVLAVELWSRPGNFFPARIREISPAADTTSRTFEARVAFDNREVGAELGQSARVFVDSDAASSTVSVPLSAVTADNGQPYVWVLDPLQQTLHKRLVTLGPYGEETVPILSGLGPDEWVLAAGTHLVREGQRIRPVDRMNRPIDLDRKLAHQE
ncbi:efflux RND transporter periplasmic adaptor subunit [Microbulbifer thermotolerans]|uniref:efflux RND transporter periplasmic adaptor subunit n=1 Tax=Microbulbifer thermotolerans TaxID=252514 RepID=UPI00224B7F5F|nr:efflux RND transporter periplasmic adaptor subunit [Microbulbifer thermotolerans]MCX2781243.1 efflux RND transporter periplasmic adaptor subunit [Microbulbifer thermotolerans]MCX2803728.1 efflux RND transporter periplasmic adaptor subunit [Microbulbifer thermotolerans]